MAEIADDVIANRLSYRKFYEQNSFDIQRKRLIKRILQSKVVFLITLKKYQLLEFYEEHIKKEKLELNIETLEREKMYENVMENQVNEYVNEVADQTAKTISNDLKRMMVGNNGYQPIDLSSVNVKINLDCGDEPTQSMTTGIDDDDFGLGLGDDNFEQAENNLQQEINQDDADIVDVMDEPEPPAKKKKKKKKAKPKMFTLQSAIDIIENELKDKDGKRLTEKKTVDGYKSTIRSVWRRLGCGEDFIKCLRTKRSIEDVETYYTKTGQKKQAANFGKGYYSIIISLSNSSPEFKKLLGQRAFKRWSDAFSNAMDKYRAKVPKKSKTEKVINFEYFTPVREQLGKQYKEAKKIYEAEKKRYDAKMKRKLSTKQKNVADKKLQVALLDFREKNMNYLIVCLQTLIPCKRGNTYQDVRIVKSAPIPYEEDSRGRGNLVKEKNKLNNYYLTNNNVLLLQKYKTRKRYKQIRIKLDTRGSNGIPTVFGSAIKLRRIIQQSIKDWDRTYLIENPKTNKPYNTLSEKIVDVYALFPELKEKNFGRPISTNTIRHSQITYFYKVKNITEAEKFKLAKFFLHMKSTSEEYLRVLNEYVPPGA